MKDFAKKFYKSKAWQEVRQAYFIYRHGICERCGKPADIVHHKIYLNANNINDPTITLSFDNLELLCIDCHNKEHSAKLPVAEGLKFDKQGNIIPSPPHLQGRACQWGPAGRPFENPRKAVHTRGVGQRRSKATNRRKIS